MKTKIIYTQKNKKSHKKETDNNSQRTSEVSRQTKADEHNIADNLAQPSPF